MIRPGPVSIPAGIAPGAVVIHVYAVPTERLLLISHASTLVEAAYRAGLDGPFAFASLRDGENAVCLVAFDGDSGARYAAEDWASA